MSVDGVSAERQALSTAPALGALLVHTRERVGRIRGELCGRWCLCPVTGARERDVDPVDLAPRLRVAGAGWGRAHGVHLVGPAFPGALEDAS
ncbi:hypothetical protein DDJ31_17190 [Streptomyces griseoviridis]|uniref:Uncharacterized protein n=1 Tax=Streptomyces griseoviridis TaxID=45398 RepID=A0ABX5TUC6_STRGD|nr:hypothetical protein DDJ31_17190 [Streptomyces griseoviridis]